MPSSARVLLIPPDTRPQTLDLPVQLAAMTGAEVRVPPADMLPDFSTPGTLDWMENWVLREAEDADVLIVCLETLCLGG